MFVIPRVNVIESDEGFSVEVLGPTRLRYVEGQRSLSVFSEWLVGPRGLVIYPSRIKSWDPPHKDDPIDDAIRRRIVDNIRRAFRFRGLEIGIEDHE